MSKARTIFDYFVGVMVIVACGLVAANILMTLSYASHKDVAAASKAAHQAQQTANENASAISEAAATADKALRIAKSKADTSHKSLAEQVAKDHEFQGQLFKWLDAQQAQLNALQREIEAGR